MFSMQPPNAQPNIPQAVVDVLSAIGAVLKDPKALEPLKDMAKKVDAANELLASKEAEYNEALNTISQANEAVKELDAKIAKLGAESLAGAEEKKRLSAMADSLKKDRDQLTNEQQKLIDGQGKLLADKAAVKAREDAATHAEQSNEATAKRLKTWQEDLKGQESKFKQAAALMGAPAA